MTGFSVWTHESGELSYLTCDGCGAVIDDPSVAINCEKREDGYYHFRTDNGERVPRHVRAFVDVRS